MEKFETHNEKDTINLAKDFAAKLKPTDIVLLCGELGCGKTKFTEGILQYYGLEDEISSPTFTIVNEYQKDSLTIYHFDVYRLSDIDEFYAIGGEEYLLNGLCIIEWGNIIEEAILSSYYKITFEKSVLDDDTRFISIEKIEKGSDIS